MADDVLMSIRPRFAEAILAGKKTVELRRRRPAFAPGTSVLIYISMPEQKVAGRFEAGEVISKAPSALWREVGQRSGVSKAEFDAYFAGCRVAHAIEIRRPARIRPDRLTFRPPQSWQYLRRSDERHRPLIRRASLGSAPALV